MQTLLKSPMRNVAWRLILTIAWFASCGYAPAVESGNESTKSTGQRAISIEPGDGTAVGTRRYAFLVGVDDYDTHLDDQLGGLSFCEADMKSMQKQLEEIGFNRVYCLTTSSRTSWQPDKKRIEQKFQELLADTRMDADDLVLVALSGHGLERIVSGGKTAAYFCPADAHSDRTETMVPIDWIYEQLDASKAGMKLLLVDACRNLSKERGGRAPQLSAEARGFMKTLADTRPPQGIAAILSCQSGEVSRESPTLGHGVFSHFILEGLAGKADSAAGNRDGFVSLPELFNYVSDQTTEFVKNNYDARNNKQTPILRGELPNYKLVRYSGPLGPTPPDQFTLSFTIREKNAQGKLLAGATVEVKYRSSASVAEAPIAGSSKTDSRGRCTLTLPGYWSTTSQGQFTALVRKDGKFKRFSLEGFPKRTDWDFYCPTELPKEIINSLGMKFKLIPAGEFMMGSNESAELWSKKYEKYGVQAFWFKDEQPRHRVRISQAFYLGQHEVTVGQFRSFVSASGYETEAEKGNGAYVWSEEKDTWERNAAYNWKNPGFRQGDDHPVVCMAWGDTIAFCNWLSKLKGVEYRLPTEAEWEYACRARTTTAYYHGDDPEGLARVGNVADKAAKSKFRWLWSISASDGNLYTAPIGQYRRNDFGLYDMHGNAQEWCQDKWHSSFYDHSPTVDPLSSSTNSLVLKGTLGPRVSRGGGWDAIPYYARSACRNWEGASLSRSTRGFRVVRVPE